MNKNSKVQPSTTSKTGSMKTGESHQLSEQAQAIVGPMIAQLGSLSNRDRAQVLRAVCGAFGMSCQVSIPVSTMNVALADSKKVKSPAVPAGTGNVGRRPMLSNPILAEDAEFKGLLAEKARISGLIRSESSRLGGRVPDSHELMKARNELDIKIESKRSSLLAEDSKRKTQSSSSKN